MYFSLKKAGVIPLISTVALPLFAIGNEAEAATERPNILYIMSDDHAAQAISAYGGMLAKILPTPNIDRIGNEGAILQQCFVTNSISTPSRATCLTGEYSHRNGVYTLSDALDTNHPNVAKELQKAGYQTAIFGKWHLRNKPTGFDDYNVLPGQGEYINPVFIEKGNWEGQDGNKGNEGKKYEGHVTDITAQMTLDYLKKTEKDKPFFVMCHFKAPHRNWIPAERFKDLFKNITIPEPTNLLDTYEGKGEQAQLLRMRLEDMKKNDVKEDIPTGLSRDDLRHWVYQRYMKDYLRCVAGVDESVGELLKYLDDNGLAQNTIVIYTSDQGFYLGEHGFFDKRLMYEESLHTPFLIRYPKEIKPKTVNKDMTVNIDFAPLFMDYAGLSKPIYMQGESFRKNLIGKTPPDWRKSIYYRYWMNADNAHNVTSHYGIRTERYKLIFFYGRTLGMSGSKKEDRLPEWEMYDIQSDPMEMFNIYPKMANSSLVKKLKIDLLNLKKQYGDKDSKYPEMKTVLEKYW
ncbi:MAG: sulfatase [Paludibacter sp.]